MEVASAERAPSSTARSFSRSNCRGERRLPWRVRMLAPAAYNAARRQTRPDARERRLERRELRTRPGLQRSASPGRTQPYQSARTVSVRPRPVTTKLADP